MKSFPNPDFEELEEEPDIIEPLEAIELCANTFFEKQAETEWEIIDSLLMMKAIETSYLLLQKHQVKLVNYT